MTSTNPTVWIEQKKQGQAHSQNEINDLVHAVMNGTMKDYQLSAWLMAVCLNGLNDDETFYLTKAFVESGDVLDLHGMGIEGITVDKHSTGGVGDKTTLIVAPLMAAAGLKVAKLSGRGLGFTGGTIDKLEAIPNFQVELSETAFVAQIQRIGLALSSQTPQLTPADGVFYALRDVTATVDNLSLIAASVMSKKIAAGADVIVLDIKAGKGAFMKDAQAAEALASLCRKIGIRFGKAVETTISPMNAPLGKAIGHTVEVIEAIDVLQGKATGASLDLEALSVKLTAMALVAAQRYDSLEAATVYVKSLLQDGSAFARFEAWAEAQGGDVASLSDTSLLAQPLRKLTVASPTTGVIRSIDALGMAQVLKALGGGRTVKTDTLDYGVGVVLLHREGDAIEAGQPLLELWVGATYEDALATQALDAVEIG
jgi:pyrimidine-nucleoside phosphorylase